MYQDIALFQTAGAAARHAAARQAQVATNMANSDTPGYRAQQIASFGAIYQDGPAGRMRATRPGHLSLSEGHSTARPRPSDVEPSPNGNTVSIEQEMVAGVAIERDHSRALAIYKHGLTVLRAVSGR